MSSTISDDIKYLLSYALKIKNTPAICGVYDLQGAVYGVSDCFAQYFGMTNGLGNLTGTKLVEFAHPNNLEHQRFVNQVSKHLLEKQQVVKEIHLHNGQLYFCTFSPLYNERNRLVGTYGLIEPINQALIDIKLSQMLIKRHGILALNSVNLSGIKLSKIEEMVIFGLIAGYSLQGIADYLQKSRSYISKIICESLCTKFAIPGYSSRLLADKLVSSGFNHFIPEQLLFHPQPVAIYTPPIQPLQLTTKQQKIVDLLMVRMTHEEIANQLGMSRALVSKIIQIELFNIFTPASRNTKELIVAIENRSK